MKTSSAQQPFLWTRVYGALVGVTFSVRNEDIGFNAFPTPVVLNLVAMAPKGAMARI